MTEPEQKLTPAQPDDLADSLSFALRHEGRKSQHDSDKLNADIVAKRLVRHLDRAGYVVMKKLPLGGARADSSGVRSAGLKADGLIHRRCPTRLRRAFDPLSGQPRWGSAGSVIASPKTEVAGSHSENGDEQRDEPERPENFLGHSFLPNRP